MSLDRRRLRSLWKFDTGKWPVLDDVRNWLIHAAWTGQSDRQNPNLPFWFFHCSFGAIGSITSQCSAILPFSTRKRS